MKLSIAGAIEEMECGGTGCEGCPYALGPEESLACTTEVPGEPLALAHDTLEASGLDASAAEGRLGREADVGRVYLPADVVKIVRILEETLEALPESEALFNQRQGLQNALALFQVAADNTKRVILAV